MAKPRVFLDSSVIITALLSSRGGSFYILNTMRDSFEFQTNEYGLREIQKTLANKFSSNPVLLTQLFLVLGTARVTTLPNPSRRERDRFAKYISVNDAPILASAIKHSDLLLTLDKEFLGDPVVRVAKKAGLKILAPREMIAIFRG